MHRRGRRGRVLHVRRLGLGRLGGCGGGALLLLLGRALLLGVCGGGALLLLGIRCICAHLLHCLPQSSRGESVVERADLRAHDRIVLGELKAHPAARILAVAPLALDSIHLGAPNMLGEARVRVSANLARG